MEVVVNHEIMSMYILLSLALQAAAAADWNPDNELKACPLRLMVVVVHEDGFWEAYIMAYDLLLKCTSDRFDGMLLCVGH